VGRSGSGDAIDFDALYRTSRDDVYAYVAGLVRDRAAAEEVTAVAFERALRRRASFEPARGSPRGWLFGIARNAALDELRRRRRTEPVAELPRERDAGAGDSTADPAVRRATVAVALESLAEGERELVKLKFYGGLANAEIGTVLGISESNVGTRLCRAVAKLREALA
jgi:RNA polymerase sigma-70 factor (ECF subfamily)